MRILWSGPAANDLTEIVTYIRRDRPSAAQRTAARIFTAVELLATFPFSGRPGVIVGTRELTVTSLPYIVVYRVSNDTLEILRIRHGAQNRRAR